MNIKSHDVALIGSRSPQHLWNLTFWMFNNPESLMLPRGEKNAATLYNSAMHENYGKWTVFILHPPFHLALPKWFRSYKTTFIHSHSCWYTDGRVPPTHQETTTHTLTMQHKQQVHHLWHVGTWNKTTDVLIATTRATAAKYWSSEKILSVWIHTSKRLLLTTNFTTADVSAAAMV